MITDAIQLARTEYVVYFLLTAYVEARTHAGRRSPLPEEVKCFPIAGKADVHDRLRVLRQSLAAHACASDAYAAIREAIDVLTAALQRVTVLESSGESLEIWNAVERSERGHERRRRLGWRMTERQAAEWAAASGARLERAGE